MERLKKLIKKGKKNAAFLTLQWIKNKARHFTYFPFAHHLLSLKIGQGVQMTDVTTVAGGEGGERERGR